MSRTQWIRAVACGIALATASVGAQEIYKTVDENGNVVYTDQKPSEDAQPVSLPELTVVDPVELGDANAVGNRSPADPPDGAVDYGLTIVSPQPEETIRNTAYTMSAAVSLSRDMPEGAQVAWIVDGEVRATTSGTSVELDEVWRGEHQFSAELRSAAGDVLASAGPVTFYMHQHSRLHPNPN